MDKIDVFHRILKPIFVKISNLANAFLVIHNEKLYEDMMTIGEEITLILDNPKKRSICIKKVKIVLSRIIKAYELVGPEKTTVLLKEIWDDIIKLEKEF